MSLTNHYYPWTGGPLRRSLTATRRLWFFASRAWKNPALLRVEDVHPKLPSEQLRRTLRLCQVRGIRPAISVIPRFVEGEVVADLGGDLAEQLRAAVQSGAELGMHGLSHQRPGGRTGDDFEFLPGDQLSAEEAAERLALGRAILAAEGLGPLYWETPHYTCDESVHRPVFTRDFPWQFERFPPTASHSRQARGVVRGIDAIWFPENLYYIPDGVGTDWVDGMLARAARLRCVPTAVAGVYVHPMIDPTLIARLLDGMIELGFEFRRLADLAPRAKRWSAPSHRLRRLALIAAGFDPLRKTLPPTHQLTLEDRH